MKIWIIEGLSRTGHWLPLWNALPRTSGPTKEHCAQALRDQEAEVSKHKFAGTYTKFRVGHYVRVE